MNKPDIHLIALDLDGTLLTSQKQLSPRNLAALTRAAELGIEIVPATGRFYGGMPDFIRALPFLHYALTINGAQVCAVPNCDPIYRAEIPWQDVVSLLRYLDKWDVTYDCYAENAAWITASMKARVHEYVRDPIYLSMIQRLREPVEDLAAFLTERRLDVRRYRSTPATRKSAVRCFKPCRRRSRPCCRRPPSRRTSRSMPLPRTRDRRFWRWPRTWDSVRSRPWPSATG